ncbi:MAG: hypothetical protein Q8M74_06305 [Chloroflexota bacterium]|nr:hypothetical protein [Chloroflexota bacterium]
MDDALNAARVVFVGTYRIPPGRLGEWRKANRELTEFVEAHEPRVTAFDHFVNKGGLRSMATWPVNVHARVHGFGR